jgi:hypothetical protein
LAGQSGHILARGQRSEARSNILASSTKLTGGVGCCCALRGNVQVTQTLADLADARGDAGSGASSLAYGPLCVGELLARVCSAQDVCRFTRGLVSPTKCLIGCGHVRCKSSNALRFGRSQGSLLCRGKPCYLVAGELLGKRLSAALVEGQFLGFLQQL